MDIVGFLPALFALACSGGLCLSNNGENNE